MPVGWLLAQTRQGSADAFAALYELHQAAAHRLARRIAGPTAADDLVQEAFGQILEQLRSGRGPTESFAAYLSVTIRNKHRDSRRRAGRELPVEDVAELLDEQQRPAGPRPGEAVDEELLRTAFGRLRDPWQEILLAVYVHDVSTTELAQLLDVSRASVASRLYRAREGLRRSYLAQHLPSGPMPTACRAVQAQLPRLVREEEVGSARVRRHLAACLTCRRARRALAALNRRLARRSPTPAEGDCARTGRRWGLGGAG